MPSINEAKRAVEAAQKQLEESVKALEQAEKKEVWPVNGDSYWYVEVSGSVYHDVWQDHPSDMDRQRLGNVYRSREDAELYVQKRLVQVELETLAKKAWKESGEQFEWDVNGVQSYYHHYYDYVDGCFLVGANVYTRCIGQVFFPTEKSAKEATTAIGEERLKVLLK